MAGATHLTRAIGTGVAALAYRAGLAWAAAVDVSLPLVLHRVCARRGRRSPPGPASSPRRRVDELVQAQDDVAAGNPQPNGDQREPLDVLHDIILARANIASSTGWTQGGTARRKVFQTAAILVYNATIIEVV